MKVCFIRSPKPRSAVLTDLMGSLSRRGLTVSEWIPDRSVQDLDLVPRHHLYVLESRTPLAITTSLPCRRSCASSDRPTRSIDALDRRRIRPTSVRSRRWDSTPIGLGRLGVVRAVGARAPHLDPAPRQPRGRPPRVEQGLERLGHDIVRRAARVGGFQEKAPVQPGWKADCRRHARHGFKIPESHPVVKDACVGAGSVTMFHCATQSLDANSGKRLMAPGWFSPAEYQSTTHVWATFGG